MENDKINLSVSDFISEEQFKKIEGSINQLFLRLTPFFNDLQTSYLNSLDDSLKGIEAIRNYMLEKMDTPNMIATINYLKETEAKISESLKELDFNELQNFKNEFENYPKYDSTDTVYNKPVVNFAQNSINSFSVFIRDNPVFNFFLFYLISNFLDGNTINWEKFLVSFYIMYWITSHSQE